MEVYSSQLSSAMRLPPSFFGVSLILALTFAPASTKAASFPDDIAEELRSYVLSLINESREEAGLPALQEDNKIEKIAQSHTEDTVSHFDPATPETREKSYLAHVSSDGKTLRERFRESGVDTGVSFAENAGYWTRDPYGNPLEASTFGLRMIHSGMMAEVPPNEGHRKAILGNFTDIGIGLALLRPLSEEDMNALFLVTDFSLHGEGAINTSPRSFPRHEIPVHGGPFLDVPPDYEFATAIRSLQDENIVEGYADGNFLPHANVKRAEILKMLLDAADFSPIGREFTQCFDDVPTYKWFGSYVCVAKRAGWVTGYGDNTFRPEASVSRAEAVALTARIFGLAGDSPLTFTDVPDNAWFSAPTKALASKKILPFSSLLFKPQAEMQRGEVAEMIYRAKFYPEALNLKH